MKPGRGSRKAIVAIATLVVAGACAVYAQAIVTRSSTVAVGPFEQKTATATCPLGKRLVALGFETTTTPDVGVIISGLGPARRSHPARARNLSSNDGSLTSIAYCQRAPRRRALRRRVRVAEQTTLGVGEVKSVTAQCPPHSSVRLGGLAAQLDDTDVTVSPAVVAVTAMERIGARNWRVTGANSGSSPGTLTAIASCGRGARLSESRSATRTASDTNQAISAVATCPAGKRLVFGGFRDSGGGTIDETVFPRELRRLSRRQWRATTFGHFGTADVTAIAYCR